MLLLRYLKDAFRNIEKCIPILCKKPCLFSSLNQRERGLAWSTPATPHSSLQLVSDWANLYPAPLRVPATVPATWIVSVFRVYLVSGKNVRKLFRKSRKENGSLWGLKQEGKLELVTKCNQLTSSQTDLTKLGTVLLLLASIYYQNFCIISKLNIEINTIEYENKYSLKIKTDRILHKWGLISVSSKNNTRSCSSLKPGQLLIITFLLI